MENKILYMLDDEYNFCLITQYYLFIYAKHVFIQITIVRNFVSSPFQLQCYYKFLCCPNPSEEIIQNNPVVIDWEMLSENTK